MTYAESKQAIADAKEALFDAQYEYASRYDNEATRALAQAKLSLDRTISRHLNNFRG